MGLVAEQRWVIVFLAGVWSFDPGAYLVGRTMDDDHYLPGYSPRDLEGVLGGLVVATAGVAVVLGISGRFPAGGPGPGSAAGRSRPGRRPSGVAPQARRRGEGLRDTATGHQRSWIGSTPSSSRHQSSPSRWPHFPWLSRVPPAPRCVWGRYRGALQAARCAWPCSAPGLDREQAVDVLAALAPDWPSIIALATGTRSTCWRSRRDELRPAAAALGTDAALDLPAGCASAGPDALEALRDARRRGSWSSEQAAWSACGGFPRGTPAGKVVATANKNPAWRGAGDRRGRARRRSGRRRPHDPLATPFGSLRPMNSEHSAIWQYLASEEMEEVLRLVLAQRPEPFLDTPLRRSAGSPQSMRSAARSLDDEAKDAMIPATSPTRACGSSRARWLTACPTSG